jgi:hypothetical protein
VFELAELHGYSGERRIAPNRLRAATA